MCGICGIFNHATNQPVDRAVLQNMTDSIAHRGPDDEGVFVSGPVGLGFRRLSIIDLAGGHQPMSESSESVWIVFNGEIYNFRELRGQLEAYGHEFRTNSDTEVIIHGYKQWGKEVFQHLNGMFGLAIWDARRSELILARDRFGIKPLYFSERAGKIIFASEIRSILAESSKSYEIDIDSIRLFLQFGFTPSPKTMYSEIQRISAGEMVVVSRKGVRKHRWWNFRPSLKKLSLSDNEMEEELTFLYQKSIERHLISDVPIGLLLSGGIDSGALLSFISKKKSDFQSFSIGYGEKFVDDELEEARKTALFFNSEFVESTISREAFEDSLSEVVGVLEEPLNSASIVPMYHLCKRVREDVKVAIMGQGPDELFGGYKRHLGLRYGSFWRAVPALLRSPLERMLLASWKDEAVRRGVEALGIRDRFKRYEGVFSIMPAGRVDSLLRTDRYAERRERPAFGGFPQELRELGEETDELGGFGFLELRYFLPDQLLLYGDKISMSFGLEVRVPYLDHTIVEFAECLPQSAKIRLLTQKWAHRRVCAAALPSESLARKKRNFGHSIINQWFQSSLEGRFEDLLQDPNSRIFEFLSKPSVDKMIAEHISGHADYHKWLYNLVVLEEWLRVRPVI